MLIKIRDTSGDWQIWDGIAHVAVSLLRIDFVKSDTPDFPNGFQMYRISGPNFSVHTPVETVPKELFLDMRREAFGKEGVQFGRLIAAVMKDGTTKTFAFATEGYLMSDEGKTLDSYNKK